jgi:hypothetical protein
MGRMAGRRIVAWVPVVMGLLVMGQGSAGPDVSAKAVVAAAAAYVAEYQRQLTFVVAEESYRQQIALQTPRDPKMPRVRTTRSEVFFLAAPDHGEWMTIRDVLAVDGSAVTDRPDLREALRTLPAREVAATFKDYNSRFNIGRVYRNFNEPTLSLLVLDEQHRSRFSFDRRRVARDGEAVLVTVAFRERESPTLIFDKRRGRVLSRGELVIDAASGRVHRAVLTAEIQNLRIALTTEYAPEDRLEMWVPAIFREEYEYGNARSSARGMEAEHVVCEATYSNFRRFETSARIK